VTGDEWKDLERAENWPSFRERLPHAPDGEAMLVEHLIRGEVSRILDLGTGDGHLIALLRQRWPAATAVGLDLSPALIDAGRRRFTEANGVRFDIHDLMQPLPHTLGRFDVVVSALAIHHLPDERKKTLFAEIFELLEQDGVFYNLDVVVTSTAELHALSQAAFGFDARMQDPSDQPARLEDQLSWLRTAGFTNVDCFWKWFELSLVGGTKPKAEDDDE
jgi:tRNA (cmo5U34)-methyltransferase